MAKRNTDSINELRSLATLLEQHNWRLEISRYGVEVLKNNSIVGLVFALEDMKVECEFVSSVENYLDDMSEYEIKNLRKTMTWKEIVEAIEQELKEMYEIQELIKNWLNKTDEE